MKAIRYLFAYALLFSAGLFADIVSVSREVTGTGRTYGGAVNGGLLMALEQYCGMSISASQRSVLMEGESGVSSTTRGSEDRQAVIDVISRESKKWSKGRIAGYSVLSESYNEVERTYTVRLSVQFPARYVVGLDPNARRRMVVAPFTPSASVINFMNVQVSTEKWCRDFHQSLNVHLTQTRKFTMLDRDFDAETSRELARAGHSNASLSDFAVRVNQKLATDYLVTGRISFMNVAPLMRDPYTKQFLPNQSVIMAEVHYRVILAPTGQLKWTDTVKVDIADVASVQGMTLEQILSAAAEKTATRISDDILSSILPFEIVKVMPSGTIVIGEGGKSLEVGEYLVVYGLGETVYDSRTGEALDEVEEELALVQVTRITEKLSYARLVKGELSKLAAGNRLRRPPAPTAIPANGVPAGSATPVNPNGSVTAPF